MSLEIVSMLLPKGYLEGRKNGKFMKAQGITIHETDNASEGADALAHGRALFNGNIKGRCWHYTVDERHAVQHLSDYEEGWHAGDGSGKGNTTTIGVEICVNSNGDYDKSVTNAAKLTAMKLKQYSLPVSSVQPHKTWSGKNCPQRLLKNWANFIKKVESFMDSKGDVPVKVFYNGKEIAEGIAYDGSVMIPVRAVVQAFGKKVNWDNVKKEVTIND